MTAYIVELSNGLLGLMVNRSIYVFERGTTISDIYAAFPQY